METRKTLFLELKEIDNSALLAVLRWRFSEWAFDCDNRVQEGPHTYNLNEEPKTREELRQLLDKITVAKDALACLEARVVNQLKDAPA